MRKFGLIGYPLSHSFSKGYFAEKFAEAGLRQVQYDNYPIANIESFPSLWEDAQLIGLNVTIPYKQAVIPYLQGLSAAVKRIGAVNCVVRTPQGLWGHNTDVIGFQRSLEPLLLSHHDGALVFGTGGAAQAVYYVLEAMGIPYQKVSRQEGPHQMSYEQLSPECIAGHTILINTTPLGMYPQVDSKPPIPYEAISSNHLLYDLVYNPEKTAFLQAGFEQGARIKNGYEMLVLQAEASWELWNETV
jgi:shikimate dehydrogenase